MPLMVPAASPTTRTKRKFKVLVSAKPDSESMTGNAANKTRDGAPIQLKAIPSSGPTS